MIETKMDVLADSFAAVEAGGVAQARPMLAGGVVAGSDAFDSYLRSGGGTVELKAASGIGDASGGLCHPA